MASASEPAAPAATAATATAAATAAVAPAKAFRVYEDSGPVHDHYCQMRSNHSLATTRRMVAFWRDGFGKRAGGRMTVREALRKIDSFVDRSDPDASFPNSLHCLQAAEGARKEGKPAWYQLVALLHDVGKLMYVWGSCEEGQGGRATDPQWALGGDTWVVGVRIPDCAVYPQLSARNADAAHPVLGAAPLGQYAPGVGIMNCEFAFGHDEYAYLWALHNKVPLPPEGLAMLRLHSCYPWHTGGAYRELMAPGDEALEAAVRDFNRFDLYTKADALPDFEAAWPHYQAIINELCPGELDW
jgi:inositol oxygenase